MARKRKSANSEASSVGLNAFYVIEGKNTVWTIAGKTPQPQLFTFRAPVNEEAYYYEYEEGQRWVDFYETCLHHIEGELYGQPLILMPWMEAVIRELFGWRRKDNGARRYKFAYICVPRKNAKTLLMSGLILGGLLIDGENKPQIYLAAATEPQAKLCYDMAVGQLSDKLEGNEELREALRPEKSFLKITQKDSTEGYIEVLAGIPKGKTGLNCHMIVMDEYHEWKSDKLRDYLETGIVSRKQPLVCIITTVGDDDESPCFREQEKVQALIDGEDDNDYYLGFIRCADKDDDITDEGVWEKANPGWNMSVNAENLRAIYLKAGSDQAKIDAFKQFHLNIWVQRTSGYLNYHEWEACEKPYTLQDLLDQDCYGGFDLSHTRDMTAFSLEFPCWWYETVLEDGKHVVKARIRPRVWSWFWVPEAVFDSNPQYRAWKNENLEVTKGKTIDRGHIKSRIIQICKRFRVHMLGYDPWRTTELFTDLAADPALKGKTEVVPVDQTYRNMGPALDEIEELVVAGIFEQPGNAILNFNVKNARVSKNKDNFKILNKSGSKKKIDGLVALAIAHRCLTLSEPPKPPRPKADVW